MAWLFVVYFFNVSKNDLFTRYLAATRSYNNITVLGLRFIIRYRIQTGRKKWYHIYPFLCKKKNCNTWQVLLKVDGVLWLRESTIFYFSRHKFFLGSIVFFRVHRNTFFRISFRPTWQIFWFLSKRCSKKITRNISIYGVFEIWLKYIWKKITCISLANWTKKASYYKYQLLGLIRKSRRLEWQRRNPVFFFFLILKSSKVVCTIN